MVQAMANISRVDLNLLVVFEAIYAQGSITRASETLHLTQPALSHALARLRELIGDPLFVRSGNRMVATALAEEIIAPVRRALSEIDGTLRQLHKFDPARSAREFRIGFRHVVETATLPSLAARARARAPEVKISSVPYERDNLHGELASGALDLAVDVLLARVEGVRHELLMSGRMVVVARQDHPRVQGAIDLATYLDLDHVLATSRRFGPGVEDLALHRLGHQRRVKLRCQHFSTACEIVARTDLVLTMHERHAQALNAPLANRILALPFEAPMHELYLYWHASADKDPGNQWLREQVVAVYATGPQA
jgi:DNA-binding transcriptional LysR family regulator